MSFYYINSILFIPGLLKLLKYMTFLKNDISTCSCWASVENGLLWRNASRPSLLYSCFRYTKELPLQPLTIQLYTFRVHGFASFLPWFPDYKKYLSVFQSPQDQNIKKPSMLLGSMYGKELEITAPACTRTAIDICFKYLKVYKIQNKLEMHETEN